jgi:hypothetical protein
MSKKSDDKKVAGNATVTTGIDESAKCVSGETKVLTDKDMCSVKRLATEGIAEVRPRTQGEFVKIEITKAFVSKNGHTHESYGEAIHVNLGIDLQVNTISQLSPILAEYDEVDNVLTLAQVLANIAKAEPKAIAELVNVISYAIGMYYEALKAKG